MIVLVYRYHLDRYAMSGVNDALRKQRPQDSRKFSEWLARSGRTDASVVWLPLIARKEDLVMLLDASTAEPLQALAIDPW